MKEYEGIAVGVGVRLEALREDSGDSPVRGMVAPGGLHVHILVGGSAHQIAARSVDTVPLALDLLGLGVESGHRLVIWQERVVGDVEVAVGVARRADGSGGRGSVLHRGQGATAVVAVFDVRRGVYWNARVGVIDELELARMGVGVVGPSFASRSDRRQCSRRGLRHPFGRSCCPASPGGRRSSKWWWRGRR